MKKSNKKKLERKAKSTETEKIKTLLFLACENFNPFITFLVEIFLERFLPMSYNTHLKLLPTIN